ncbi:MAG: SpoIIE family protein phosphatase, partial [Deltaproteobacteria bacterium]|nr:SpoIIE family protein phosphatase [Deltaproteobacteria bacterium]
LYRWPKPTREGLVTDVQKLSYVRLFQDWGWIIGTGIYVDDALTDALEKSKADIRAMRYDDGIGYFWINDTGRPIPKIIMHPLQPSLEGAVLDKPEYNCAFGTDKNLFQAFVDVCSMQGDGFVEYLWPKPTDNGLTTPQPKLSYVRLYEPLGWIIGTGVYVDSIDAGIRKKTSSMHTQVNYLIINIMVITSVFASVAILLSLFCAGSLTRPIGKLITMMQEIRNEGISKKRVDLNGAREINDLGIIFNSMLDNIDQATRELTETTAAKERIESELNIARDIQMSIIPKLFPAFPERTEFDVQAVLQTAKAVGGDLYDFFFIDKNHLCFAIGDVSGKGVPASLFMAVTRTLLRAHAVDGLTAGQIVTNMNEILYRDNDMCMFVTFYLSILTISTGDIQICNAGHNPPVLIRRGQSLEQLTQRHGVPLGALEDAVYATDTVNLQPGDTLFLYTDGVTEAENSRQELFGEARLDEVLERNKTG